MSKLLKREVILAKIQTDADTPATPVAANDAMLVENVGWSFAGARMTDRPVVKPTLGQLARVFGGTLMEVTFDVEIKGSGTAGTAPEVAPLLKACGFDETIVGATSVTYAPVSTGFEYLTLWFYEDGSLYKLTGAQGNFETNLTTGETGKLSFTIIGHLGGPTDAALVSPTYASQVPVPFIGATFATGGFASVINSLTFTPGNEVVTPPSANSADGYGTIQISDRDYTGSFDPQAELIATDDPIGDWQAGTAKTIATGAIGATAGNIYALNITSATYTEISPGDRDGIRTHEIGFMSGAGDTACSLVFT